MGVTTALRAVKRWHRAARCRCYRGRTGPGTAGGCGGTADRLCAARGPGGPGAVVVLLLMRVREVHLAVCHRCRFPGP